MTKKFSYEITATDGNARTGVIKTCRGEIRTPAFMPVGTAATVKGMKPETVRQTGADIILGNTYHLMLRPTAERIDRLGGLHKFMNWDRPILTDSGGFQVMSLAKLRKITEEGVAFQSHIDGKKYMLSPERSMEIQRLLGANIVMAFDECTPFPATVAETEKSMLMSMRWARRSYEAYHNGSEYAEKNALFGIVQGGVFEHLRRHSVDALKEIDCQGYAIGGLAVGEGQEVMFEVLDYTMPQMLKNKPRYLMGVGKPDDIVGAVERGIDMFDCVLPSRSGRTGQAFTRRGAVNMKNARHVDDPRPIDEACSCAACSHYSRAYISHLFRGGELLGPMLLTEHNLTYYQDLMSGLRRSIAGQKLQIFVKNFHEKRAVGDIEAL